MFAQEGTTCSLIQECVNGVNMFDYLHKYHKTVPIGKQLGIALQVPAHPITFRVCVLYLHTFKMYSRCNWISAPQIRST